VDVLQALAQGARAGSADSAEVKNLVVFAVALEDRHPGLDATAVNSQNAEPVHQRGAATGIKKRP